MFCRVTLKTKLLYTYLD